MNARGMTLIEMMVALVIFTLVVAGALSTMEGESRAYSVGSERMGLIQNLRFASNALEKDLRVAGSNVPAHQPFLVYAGADVLAFNGDFATNVANDPFAVYYDPDAPGGAVTALTTNRRITIPNTAFSYPAVNYTVSGQNSPAELIMFYFAPDSSTTRGDDFVLYRRVNDRDPELVARNILQTPGRPFFEYVRTRTFPSAPTVVEVVPSGSLPLRHSIAEHLAPGDTGAFAVIDSIRGVRFSFTTTNGRSGADEQSRAVSRLVDLPNAGKGMRQTCGDEPLLGTALVAIATVDAAGTPVARLTWNRATDEGGGEQDVVRYVIWRRDAGAADWGDPRLSLPAGQAAYLYDDTDVTSGASYEYALAAQDCTPSLSSTVSAGPVVIP